MQRLISSIAIETVSSYPLFGILGMLGISSTDVAGESSKSTL